MTYAKETGEEDLSNGAIDGEGDSASVGVNGLFGGGNAKKGSGIVDGHSKGCAQNRSKISSERTRKSKSATSKPRTPASKQKESVIKPKSSIHRRGGRPKSAEETRQSLIKELPAALRACVDGDGWTIVS